MWKDAIGALLFYRRGTGFSPKSWPLILGSSHEATAPRGRKQEPPGGLRATPGTCGPSHRKSRLDSGGREVEATCGGGSIKVTVQKTRRMGHLLAAVIGREDLPQDDEQ